MTKMMAFFPLVLAALPVAHSLIFTTCYNDLGCFPMTYPWLSPIRPFPQPWSPREIDVRIYLWTRSTPHHQIVSLRPDVSLNGTSFDSARSKTVFITHGFISNGKKEWVLSLKDAYLSQADVNVFIVDWSKGASTINYLQAASNIRVVGAELIRFGKHLIKEGVLKSNIHLIGHSLGAHVSAYMAKGLKDKSQVGRITALDPAQPGFEGFPSEVRLSGTDAHFVDVLHSDSRPFIPTLGFGMIQPVGDVDFYINGGSGQPGCLNGKIRSVNSILDLADIPMAGLVDIVSCSHLRGIEVFISSLLSFENCTMWGRKITLPENILMLTTLGTMALPDFLSGSGSLKNSKLCNGTQYTALGLPTPLCKARGTFLIYTRERHPFCITEREHGNQILLKRKLESIPRDIGDGIEYISQTVESTITSIFSVF